MRSFLAAPVKHARNDLCLPLAAILIDMHDEWIAGDRRHLSEGSTAKLYDTSDDGDLAAIGSDE